MMCRLTWLLGAAFCCAASAQGAQHDARKHALIVAVGEYGSPDWDTLSSGNDVPLVTVALELHGFASESIHVVSDQAATKQGILDAIETIIASAREGDVVFFHYSGHGQRIADDDGDELDGFDEALVPFDAPKGGDGYGGELHLRDDELNQILQRLRRAVGPSGNVILSIDSCFSGGASRGSARGRGGPVLSKVTKAGEDLLAGKKTSGTRSVTLENEDAGGGFFEAPRTRGIGDSADPLAPYVVFTAARHDQLAYETVDDEGRVVGPLSFAMSKALASPSPLGTYRDLFGELEWVMQARVPNRPQIEGDIDAELFSGAAVFQRPYVDVASVLSGGTQVVLAAGSLTGLLEGSRVELHRAGAREPAPETLLAVAVVSEATSVDAVADLETPVSSAELERSHAFVTDYAFGDLRVAVSLAAIEDAELRQRLEDELGDTSVVELVDSDAELTVRDSRDGRVSVEMTATSEPIYGPEPEDVDAIRARLTDYARSRYLRGLKLDDPEFRVVLEIVPLDANQCRNPRDPNTCAELDPAAAKAEGRELRFQIGDYFKIRARNESNLDAYVAVLDLPSDGTVNALWPADDRAEKKPLEAGETWTAGVVYQFAEPTGTDVMLLLASEDWIDFRPFLTGAGARQRNVTTSLGPFAPLFDDDVARTRAAVVYPPGSVSTHAVTLTVER